VAREARREDASEVSELFQRSSDIIMHVGIRNFDAHGHALAVIA